MSIVPSHTNTSYKQGSYTLGKRSMVDAFARTMVIVMGCAVFQTQLPDPSEDSGKRRIHFYLLKAWAGGTDSAGRIALQAWMALLAARFGDFSH